LDKALSCFFHDALLSDKHVGFDGFNGLSAHVPLAPMRTLLVVVLKPLIQVRLEFLHRGVELLPEGLPKELVEAGPVESLHGAVGPWPVHVGAAVLDSV
jgi:hypothetical protein